MDPSGKDDATAGDVPVSEAAASSNIREYLRAVAAGEVTVPGAAAGDVHASLRAIAAGDITVGVESEFGRGEPSGEGEFGRSELSGEGTSSAGWSRRESTAKDPTSPGPGDPDLDL